MPRHFRGTRFELLYQDGGNGKWISGRLNNGEFDYWLIVELTDLVDAVGQREARDMGGKYNASLSVVSPSEAGKKNLKDAAESMGEEPKGWGDAEKAEALDAYGVKATVWQKNGNNAKKLLKAAREEAEKVQSLFGFYMDQAMNRMGNTGWDFIKGDIGFGR